MATKSLKATLDSRDQLDSSLVARFVTGDDAAFLELQTRWAPMTNRQTRKFHGYATKQASAACLDDFVSEATVTLLVATRKFQPCDADGFPRAFGPFYKLLLGQALAAVVNRDGAAVKISKKERKELLASHYATADTPERQSAMPRALSMDVFTGENDTRGVANTISTTAQTRHDDSIESLRVAAWTDPILADALDRARNGKPLKKGQIEHLRNTYKDVAALSQSWCR